MPKDPEIMMVGMVEKGKKEERGFFKRGEQGTNKS